MGDATKRKPMESTKKMISVMLDGDDDNIALDQLIISLLDPVSGSFRKPLVIPTISVIEETHDCSHSYKSL